MCPESERACAQTKVKPGSLYALSAIVGKEERGLTSLSEVVIKEKKPWWANFIQKTLSWRDGMSAHLKGVLPPTAASLTSGMIFGVQEELPEALDEALIITGTYHVVAASGYNITLLVGAVSALAVLLVGRKWSIVAGWLAVIVYVIMAGFNPPVLRAGVMALLAYTAQYFGKESWGVWTLGVTTVILLSLFPWMASLVSFQLSLAATAGIMLGTETITTFLSQKIQVEGTMWWEQGIRLLLADLTTTLAATLATLPIILIYFGRLSLISPVTNAISLWLVPLIMSGGVLILLAGLGGVWLSQIIAWLVYPFIYFFIQLIMVTSRIPLAAVDLSGVGWAMAAGWWCLLAAWWSHKNKLDT